LKKTFFRPVFAPGGDVMKCVLASSLVPILTHRIAKVHVCRSSLSDSTIPPFILQASAEAVKRKIARRSFAT
jgi:hypothetical protein